MLLILAGLVFFEANRNAPLLPDLGSGGINPIDPTGKFGVSPNAFLYRAGLNGSGVARIDQHDDRLRLSFFGHDHYDQARSETAVSSMLVPGNLNLC